MKRLSLLAFGLVLPMLPPPAGAIEVTIYPQFADTAWVSLDAGTYAVEAIEGGWSPWDYTTCVDGSGCTRTCPTTETGWVGVYRAVSAELVYVSVDGVPYPPLPSVPPCDEIPVSYFVQGAGLVFYKADNSLVFPTPQSALANAPVSAFTLGSAGAVGFTLTSSALSDNRGSLTLRVGPVAATAVGGAIEARHWGGVKALYH